MANTAMDTVLATADTMVDTTDTVPTDTDSAVDTDITVKLLLKLQIFKAIFPLL